MHIHTGNSEIVQNIELLSSFLLLKLKQFLGTDKTIIETCITI